MHQTILCVVLFSLLAMPAAGVERASDAADFRDFVEVCAGNTDERGVDGCIADQVSSRDSYLGDILAETAQGLNAADEKRLNDSQEAFEAYRDAACRYAVAAAAEHGRRAQMFCELRLTNQRIADILEGSDFLIWAK